MLPITIPMLLPNLDYHLYQVDYSADKVPRLVIQINGQEAPYRQTMTTEPLAFAEAAMGRHEASNLYEARTPYLGNASAVVNLIDRTGLPRFGPYTIELQTKEEPFGLRIFFEASLETFGQQDRAYAIVLLGLIENLSYVEVVGSDGTQRITIRGSLRRTGLRRQGTWPVPREAGRISKRPLLVYCCL
jgi:hypothetical protein